MTKQKLELDCICPTAKSAGEFVSPVAGCNNEPFEMVKKNNLIEKYKIQNLSSSHKLESGHEAFMRADVHPGPSLSQIKDKGRPTFFSIVCRQISLSEVPPPAVASPALANGRMWSGACRVWDVGVGV